MRALYSTSAFALLQAEKACKAPLKTFLRVA
jgi:hypothetical protein